MRIGLSGATAADCGRRAARTALWSVEGTLRGFAKIVQDLNERKRWEDAVVRSEQRFRALIEQQLSHALLPPVDDGPMLPLCLPSTVLHSPTGPTTNA